MEKELKKLIKDLENRAETAANDFKKTGSVVHSEISKTCSWISGELKAITSKK